MERLEQRANMLKALHLTESALAALGTRREHARLIDLYLDAMRELSDLLEENMRAGLSA